MNRHSLLLALNKGDKNVILGKNGLNSKTLQCKKKCYCKKSVSAIAIEYNCILVINLYVTWKSPTICKSETEKYVEYGLI